MGNDRKFYITTLTIRVLAEDAPWDGNLEWLSHDVTKGEYVGDVTATTVTEVSETAMHAALVNAGSDPDFFSHEFVESVKEDDAPVQSTEVQVRFRPQAWVNNNAIDVDIDEPNIWFVEVDSEGPTRWADEAGRDSDFLKFDPFAPKWVTDYQGPFNIELVTD